VVNRYKKNEVGDPEGKVREPHREVLGVNKETIKFVPLTVVPFVAPNILKGVGETWIQKGKLCQLVGGGGNGLIHQKTRFHSHRVIPSRGGGVGGTRTGTTSSLFKKVQKRDFFSEEMPPPGAN